MQSSATSARPRWNRATRWSRAGPRFRATCSTHSSSAPSPFAFHSSTSASTSTRCSPRSRLARSSSSSPRRTIRPGRRTIARSSTRTSSASRRTFSRCSTRRTSSTWRNLTTRMRSPSTSPPGRRVLVLRTFSKIFGLAGLRVGYGIGPDEVIAAIGKVRRAFDVTSVGQEAALASLSAPEELARRRAANRDAMSLLQDVAPRARPRAGRAGRRELPLRPRRRRRCRERRVAPPRGHRAADGRVRRARTRFASRSARRRRSACSATRLADMSAVAAR